MKTRICEVAGCENKYKGHGFCQNHLRKYRRWGSPFSPKKIQLECAVFGCKCEIYAKNYCRKHWRANNLYGNPLAFKSKKGMPETFIRNLLLNLNRECCEWPFAKDENGYGIYMSGNRKVPAHRFVLNLFTFQNPTDLHAAHGPCNNPSCVNPLHLSWKTPRENSLDKIRDGTVCRGESQHNSRLSESQVLDIYTSPLDRQTLAKKFDVSPSAIDGIVQGRNWRWLTQPPPSHATSS